MFEGFFTDTETVESMVTAERAQQQQQQQRLTVDRTVTERVLLSEAAQELGIAAVLDEQRVRLELTLSAVGAKAAPRVPNFAFVPSRGYVRLYDYLRATLGGASLRTSGAREVVARALRRYGAAYDNCLSLRDRVATLHDSFRDDTLDPADRAATVRRMSVVLAQVPPNRAVLDVDLEQSRVYGIGDESAAVRDLLARFDEAVRWGFALGPQAPVAARRRVRYSIKNP